MAGCWWNRIEGYATKTEWHRAYGEINEFERMLDDDGVRLVKIFLHMHARGATRAILGALQRPPQALEAFRGRPPQPGPLGRL